MDVFDLLISIYLNHEIKLLSNNHIRIPYDLVIIPQKLSLYLLLSYRCSNKSIVNMKVVLVELGFAFSYAVPGSSNFGYSMAYFSRKNENFLTDQYNEFVCITVCCILFVLSLLVV